MQKITPFLWFDNNAEEALNFYTEVFKDASVNSITRYGAGGPGQEGSVMTASMKLFGQDFVLLNGGPVYKPTPAVSFVISCADQEEIDYYWERLTSDGGRENQCGWLEDKFGVSWQVVPPVLIQLMGGPDREGVKRMMQAMMGMRKLVIADLQRAYDGE